ncbi:MAG: hypothetical protein M3362_12475, partial [Acidobacteriota bacterium]|nr:hypothetical protein [Acidobacteriota bacterium]
MNSRSRLMASITFLTLLALFLQGAPLGTVVLRAARAQGRENGGITIRESGVSKMSAIDSARVEGILSAKSGKTVGAESPGRVRQGSKNYLALGIEFDSTAARQNFSVPGTKVFTSFERFADVFADTVYDREADDYVLAPAIEKAINANPHIIWVELLRAVKAPPPPPVTPRPRTKQVPDQIVRGGFDGLTGKGVTIAIIDSGLDFRNPDF